MKLLISWTVFEQKNGALKYATIFCAFFAFLKVPEKLAVLNVSASYKQLVNYLTSKK